MSLSAIDLAAELIRFDTINPPARRRRAPIIWRAC